MTTVEEGSGTGTKKHNLSGSQSLKKRGITGTLKLKGALHKAGYGKEYTNEGYITNFPGIN